jgi:hypothetical protein
MDVFGKASSVAEVAGSVIIPDRRFPLCWIVVLQVVEFPGRETKVSRTFLTPNSWPVLSTYNCQEVLQQSEADALLAFALNAALLQGQSSTR